MAGALSTIAQIVLPKGKGTKGGASFTPGYQQTQPIMTIPTYRDHLSDLYSSRTANDARTLLNTLVNQDPDVSAAVHSYLTIASSSDLVIYAFDAKNEIDAKGIELARQILGAITTTNDYTLGYSNKPTLDGLVTDMRYWALLRGSVGSELVLDKTYTPSEIRHVDTATLEWHQPQPGVYAPLQKPTGSNAKIDLNIPTFFATNFHQNPSDMYTYSPFVAAINTIAARTEVINELYRIMKVVGYPRLDVSVLEEVLMKNVPPAFRVDPNAAREHVNKELVKVQGSLSGLSADQAFVHSDAIKAQIINDKNPSAGIQIQGVIDVLDSQNQAALKVMPAVVGKGSNIQTASTEARLFAMSTDALNLVVGGQLSKILTLATRLAGYQGRIEARFRNVELRPIMELEPQLTMRSARLRQELSLGTISDIEYHMEMFGRPPGTGAPQLSGTNFLAANADAAQVDTTSITPNSDPLGKSIAPPGGKSARSNTTRSGQQPG